MALDHQEPDRVPIDLGGSVVTSIAHTTYGDLRDHLGLPQRPIRTLETVQQIAAVDLIDVHFTADDLTGQCRPLISPALYRRMIKPRWARILAAIRRKTEAKIFYHSCGAVSEFLRDLIEIGVEIINPVQVSAAGMDTSGLKKKYGKHLSFWGGGCDTQRVLNLGSRAEVRAEVRRRVADLAPGGGFVFNPVHNIQPHISPSNIVAMFQAAREFGTSPIGNC
jgi:uroporphyrinogen decarboxylase